MFPGSFGLILHSQVNSQSSQPSSQHLVNQTNLRSINSSILKSMNQRMHSSIHPSENDDPSFREFNRPTKQSHHYKWRSSRSRGWTPTPRRSSRSFGSASLGLPGEVHGRVSARVHVGGMALACQDLDLRASLTPPPGPMRQLELVSVCGSFS